jgi:hypothetical protein
MQMLTQQHAIQMPTKVVNSPSTLFAFSQESCFHPYIKHAYTVLIYLVQINVKLLSSMVFNKNPYSCTTVDLIIYVSENDNEPCCSMMEAQCPKQVHFVLCKYQILF